MFLRHSCKQDAMVPTNYSLAFGRKRVESAWHISRPWCSTFQDSPPCWRFATPGLFSSGGPCMFLRHSCKQDAMVPTNYSLAFGRKGVESACIILLWLLHLFSVLLWTFLDVLKRWSTSESNCTRNCYKHVQVCLREMWMVFCQCWISLCFFPATEHPGS